MSIYVLFIYNVRSSPFQFEKFIHIGYICLLLQVMASSILILELHAAILSIELKVHLKNLVLIHYFDLLNCFQHGKI